MSTRPPAAAAAAASATPRGTTTAVPHAAAAESASPDAAAESESDGDDRDSSSEDDSENEPLSPAFFRSFKSYAPFLDKGDPSQRSLTEKAIVQHGWTKGVHSRRVCMYSTLSHRSQHPFVAELIMHPKDQHERELNKRSKRQLIMHDTRIRLGLGEEVFPAARNQLLERGKLDENGVKQPSADQQRQWAMTAKPVANPSNRWPEMWKFAACEVHDGAGEQKETHVEDSESNMSRGPSDAKPKQN